MCEDADETFKEISEQCGNLTIYGVQSRYPYEIDITASAQECGETAKQPGWKGILYSGRSQGYDSQSV